MKKLFKGFILLTALFSEAYHARSQACNASALYDRIRGSEDRIRFRDPVKHGDENPLSYDFGDFETAKHNFESSFFYREDEVPLLNPDRDMKVGSFCRFMDDIISRGYDFSRGDLSGLLMYLGMEDNRTQIVFEPVYLKRTDFSKQYQIIFSHIYYLAAADGSLISINESQKNSITEKYTGSADKESQVFIRRYAIKNDPVNNNHRYINAPQDIWDIHADVSYCTLPFQQILKLYKDNLPEGSPGSDNDIIHFRIVAKGLVGCDNYKLHVAAYTRIEDGGDTIHGSYKNRGADFSQMSPPNRRDVFKTQRRVKRIN